MRLFIFWEKLWLDNFVSRSTDEWPFRLKKCQFRRPKQMFLVHTWDIQFMKDDGMKAVKCM